MRTVLAAALLYTSLTVSVDAKPPTIGVFETHQDIGSPTLAGSAAYKGGAYVITAAGYNIARNRDEFHYVWRKVSGDFSVEGEVMFDGPGLTPHRKAGVMARASLADNAAHIDVSLHGDGPRSVVVREANGELTKTIELEPRTPVLPAGTPSPLQSFRMERHGNRFDFVMSQPGKPDVTKSVEMNLPQDIYLGLFLSSHNAEIVEKATFRKVRFKTR